MKKYAALLVTGVVALGMTACGQGAEPKPAATTVTVAPSVTTEVETHEDSTPTEQPTTKVEPSYVWTSTGETGSTFTVDFKDPNVKDQLKKVNADGFWKQGFVLQAHNASDTDWDVFCVNVSTTDRKQAQFCNVNDTLRVLAQTDADLLMASEDKVDFSKVNRVIVSGNFAEDIELSAE